MEKDIFEWVDWDEIEKLVIRFYRCTFIKDFAPFHKNDVVDNIIINYAEGIMEVFKTSADNEESITLEITLAVK